MHLLTSINPNNLSPDALALELGPFGSWPDEGLPASYFRNAADPEIAPFYDQHGFIVLHEALRPDEIDALRAETARICRNADGKVEGVEPAPAEADDTAAMRRVLCIHFPHKISGCFRDALSLKPAVDILTTVIGPNVKCMQSMLFLKASGKPGQAWHQDEDFIPTRDRSLTGAWIALDDATVENGCLWVLPGSHKPGILWPQKIHFDQRFDCTHESFAYPYRDEDSIPVEVKAGSIIFFNGYLLHRSLPNRSQTAFRRSLVNHYMSAESLLPWKKPEQASVALADYRDIVMVAGTDPFAWKGLTDEAHAFVRADGLGGCADWNEENRARARELASRVAATPVTVGG